MSKKEVSKHKNISALLFIGVGMAVLIGISAIAIALNTSKKESLPVTEEVSSQTDSQTVVVAETSEVMSEPQEIVASLSPDEIDKTKELKKKSEAIINSSPVKAEVTQFDTSMLSQSAVLLDVKYLPQNPELPTGCEITSLTTILNFYGYDILKTVLSENYLQKSAAPADWTVTFVGDPTDPSSFGCYAQPIVDAANRFFAENGGKHIARNASASSFTDVLKEIEEGRPVALWGTTDLKEPKKTISWAVDGKEMQWIAPEHCYVLMGYDIERNVAVISDPLKGIVEYNLNTVKKRYEQLGCQCVFISEIPPEEPPAEQDPQSSTDSDISSDETPLESESSSDFVSSSDVSEAISDESLPSEETSEELNGEENTAHE